MSFFSQVSRDTQKLDLDRALFRPKSPSHTVDGTVPKHPSFPFGQDHHSTRKVEGKEVEGLIENMHGEGATLFFQKLHTHTDHEPCVVLLG